MPDIAMCRNEKCIDKALCYRYTAEPDPYQQSYAYFPEPKNPGECLSFWPQGARSWSEALAARRAELVRGSQKTIPKRGLSGNEAMDQPEVNVKKEKEINEEHAQALLECWIEYLKKNGNGDLYEGRPSFEYDDFDYLIGKNGKLAQFLEVKRRRNTFAKYDTIIVPLRKHHFSQACSYPVWFLCSWSCGTVAYINLAQKPDKEEGLTRADRGVNVLHAFYGRERFTVIREANECSVRTV